MTCFFRGLREWDEPLGRGSGRPGGSGGYVNGWVGDPDDRGRWVRLPASGWCPFCPVEWFLYSVRWVLMVSVGLVSVSSVSVRLISLGWFPPGGQPREKVSCALTVGIISRPITLVNNFLSFFDKKYSPDDKSLCPHFLKSFPSAKKPPRCPARPGIRTSPQKRNRNVRFSASQPLYKPR